MGDPLDRLSKALKNRRTLKKALKKLSKKLDERLKGSQKALKSSQKLSKTLSKALKKSSEQLSKVRRRRRQRLCGGEANPPRYNPNPPGGIASRATLAEKRGHRAEGHPG